MQKLMSHIQESVDQYIQYYTQQKEIAKKMQELRKEIEPFMTEHNVETLEGENVNGKISIKPYERASTTSKYSTYELEDILPLLSDYAKERCIVEVVDKDLLESLSKIGEVPKEVLDMKKTSSSIRFSVEI